MSWILFIFYQLHILYIVYFRNEFTSKILNLIQKRKKLFENLEKKEKSKNKPRDEENLDEASQLHYPSTTLSDKKKIKPTLNLELETNLCDMEKIFTSLIE